MKSIQQKKHLTLIIVVLFLLLQSTCRAPAPTPSLAPISILPNTWTPEPIVEITYTPTTAPTPVPTITPKPSENWWAISIEPNRDLRVNFAKESSDGGILLWAQVRDKDKEVIEDIIIKLQTNGFLDWKKSIYPTSARVQYIQDMDDGTLLLTGFDQGIDHPNPFYIQISENGEIISSMIYRGRTDILNRYYLQTPNEEDPGYHGEVIIKGELPGTHYVSDYAIHPDGGMTVIGEIHGPITSDGATFSYLRGLWAIRFDQENQIIWQRFFQTKPTGPFFNGEILPDGSIVITQDQTNYLSILKLDPDGYTIFWKYYSSIISVQSLSGTQDGGIIITHRGEYLTKLDSTGNILWSKELVIDQDQIWIEYAFESTNGDLILVIGSGQHGTIVARLKMEGLFITCPRLAFQEYELWEHSPYPAYNISGSVRVIPYPNEMVELSEKMSLKEEATEIKELCRYRDLPQ